MKIKIVGKSGCYSIKRGKIRGPLRLRGPAFEGAARTILGTMVGPWNKVRMLYCSFWNKDKLCTEAKVLANKERAKQRTEMSMNIKKTNKQPEKWKYKK